MATKNAAGIPLKDSGISARSSLSRIPDIITRTSVNPTPAPRALTIVSIKLYPVRTLMNVIPSTAQFVVISGKYTPSAL